jgi:hypothetical protein
MRTGYGHDKCAACYIDREGTKGIMGVTLAETIAGGEGVNMEEVVIMIWLWFVKEVIMNESLFMKVIIGLLFMKEKVEKEVVEKEIVKN